MKKVFKLSINGKFAQYLMPSEVKLLKWEDGQTYTLIPTEITVERYKFIFGKY